MHISCDAENMLLNHLLSDFFPTKKFERERKTEVKKINPEKKEIEFFLLSISIKISRESKKFSIYYAVILYF